MTNPISLTLPKSDGTPFSIESLRGSPVLLIEQGLEQVASTKWFTDRARLWAERNPARAAHLRLVVSINLASVPAAFRGPAKTTAAAMVPSNFVSALLFDEDGTTHRAFGVDKMQHPVGVDYRTLLVTGLLDSEGRVVWGRSGDITMQSADVLERKLVELTDPLLSA